MTKEIKFRAWDKYEKVMFQPTMLYDRVGFSVTLESESEYSYSSMKWLDNTPLMQYTGLKDKNGVEIYEEDAITDGDYTFIVKWQSGGFILSPIKYSKNKPYIGRQIVEIQNATYLEESCEVIGNIYENKGLLND